MNAVSETSRGTMVLVKVVPNASRSEVSQVGPDAIRIRLQAPAVEGKANKALVEFLADTLGVRARQVTIAGGEHARQKRVMIADMPASEVSRRLGGEQ
jgi:uncharacterized protein (TIGR00251 family)